MLNDAYRPWRFQFELQRPINRIVNDDYWPLRLGTTGPIKIGNRKGTGQDLNVYLSLLADKLLGWATLPPQYRLNNQDDGIVIQYTTLPGMSNDPEYR